MTTVALRDLILAADSQVTLDDVKLQSSDKIEIINNETIFAAAGSDTNIKQAIRFFALTDWEERLGTDKAPVFKSKDLDGILIYKGSAYSIDASLFPDRIVHPYFAVGSGWKFAMAAMHMGLSAPDAVKFASEFDIYTSPPIRVLNVKEFFENAGTRTTTAKKRKRKEVSEGIQTETEGRVE